MRGGGGVSWGEYEGLKMCCCHCYHTPVLCVWCKQCKGEYRSTARDCNFAFLPKSLEEFFLDHGASLW